MFLDSVLDIDLWVLQGKGKWCDSKDRRCHPPAWCSCLHRASSPRQICTWIDKTLPSPCKCPCKKDPPHCTGIICDLQEQKVEGSSCLCLHPNTRPRLSVQCHTGLEQSPPATGPGFPFPKWSSWAQHTFGVSLWVLPGSRPCTNSLHLLLPDSSERLCTQRSRISYPGSLPDNSSRDFQRKRNWYYYNIN